MNNLVFGISTILCCIIVCSFSWRYYSKSNYKIAIFLIVLCGLALRIYISTDFFLHTWDERFHALVAKNLIQHPLKPTLYDHPLLPYDYKNWDGNHIWLHKQPFPLWIMASSLWLFGVNEIALRIPSIILSTIGILLTYFIGKYFYNKKVGYLSAFFYSINGLIIELTGGRVATDHIDIFFLFFIELAIVFSILFAQKKNVVFNILAGITIGAAVLSKWLPALIVLPVWILIVCDSGNFKIKTIVIQFNILLVICLLVFLPWQIYIYKTFPDEANWEALFNFRHITEVLEGQTGPIYYFVNQIRINYGELIYLPLLWFLWKTFKDLKEKKRLAILIWFMVPFLFFSFVKTKMEGYILFASPALFLMTAEFYFTLSDYKNNHRHKWFYNFILFLLIALPVRYTIERVKPFEKIERNPQRIADLKRINAQKINKGVLFNYNNPIEAMFYTDLVVYPNVPEKKIITELQQKGYTIMINDKQNVPMDIKSLKGVKIVKFFEMNK